MRRTLAPTLALALFAGQIFLAGLLLLPGQAGAQNFFEELFGVGRGARPPAPPRGVPQAPAPLPGEALPPGELPPEAKPAAPVVPRQPVVLKAPTEDAVNGQDLMLNGLNGQLKLERTGTANGTAMTARVTLPGTKISQPAETCSVKLGGGAPIAVTSEGRPEGVPRFEAAAAECPLRFSILDGSVQVTPLGGSRVCTFTAADCAANPSGLWGPAAAALIPQAGEFDTARGVADKAVRDNYKVMSQRVGRDGIRPVVQEQAAFSSEREELCRTYAREGAHGFCHLRFTEARALSLATRLGANTAAAAATPTAPRPRRTRPSVDGVNPEAVLNDRGPAFADP